jgi:hypothetical protein
MARALARVPLQLLAVVHVAAVLVVFCSFHGSLPAGSGALFPSRKQQVRRQLNNSLWILVFAAGAVSAACFAVRYGVSSSNDLANASLYLIAVIFSAAKAALLTVALFYDCEYRALAIVRPDEHGARQRRMHIVYASVGLVHFVADVLLAIHVVAIEEDWSLYGFLCSLWTLRLGSLVAAGLNVLKRRAGDEYVPVSSREVAVLAAAVLLDVFDWAPPTAWQAILPSSCVLVDMSAVDLMVALSCLPVLAYVGFVGLEFRRVIAVR